jgi:2-dehydropantoate 2-reductase
VFLRIPRNLQWRCDNLYDGRVAIGYLSTHSRTYWWSRRKHYECAHGNLRLCSSTRFHRGYHRGYNTEAAERRIYDTPQDIPFLDGFPERLIREGLPGRLKREGIRKRELAIEDILRPPSERKSGGEPSQEVAEEHKESLEDQEATPPDPSAEVDMFSVLGPAIDEYAKPTETPFNSILEESARPVETLLDDEMGILDEPEQVSEPLPRALEDQISTDENKFSQLTATHSPVEHRLELEHETSSTIHVLGATRFGKYIAHSLAGLPHAPPVTLLLHTNGLMRRWEEEGAAIRVLREGKLTVQSEIEVEFSGDFESRGFQGHSPRGRYSSNDSIIHNLVVATDGFATLPALTAIVHRLRPWTSICFLQDGMGIIDKINSNLFPDPMRRPHYALGNMSHKLTPTERFFTLIEREAGDVSLSVLMRTTKPRDQFLGVPQERPLVRRLDGGWARFVYLLRTLTRSPELKARALSRPDFHMEQLEKLAVNAALGPLSVLYDCPNDQLLNNYNVRHTMRLVLQETSLILRSLPEISRVARIHDRFSAQRLERIFFSTIRTTRENTSAMLQDVRAGKRTGIDFYNGYLVSRAMELGIACPHNEMLLAMVKAKQVVGSRKDEWHIPIRDEY